MRKISWMTASCLVLVGQSQVPAQQLESYIRLPLSADRDEPSFHAIGTVAFRGASEIMVFDHFNTSIRLFDLQGRKLREFGRSGQGPGEFTTWAMNAGALPNRFWVSDPRTMRVTWFDDRGNLDGTRTIPDFESNAIDRNVQQIIPVRFDQLLIATAGRDTMGAVPVSTIRLSLVGRSNQPRPIVRYPSGLGYFVQRSGQGRPRGGFPFGPGGAWGVAGDSVLATVDSYRGGVRWYRIANGQVQQIAARDLNLTPKPAVEKGEVPQGYIARNPPYDGYFSRVFVSDRHDLWLEHAYTGRITPDHRRTFTVVPRDSTQSTRQIILPPGFWLHQVVGNVLLGQEMDAERVQSVRAYRMR